MGIEAAVFGGRTQHLADHKETAVLCEGQLYVPRPAPLCIPCQLHLHSSNWGCLSMLSGGVASRAQQVCL